MGVLDVEKRELHAGTILRVRARYSRWYPQIGAMQRAAMRRYAHINSRKPLISKVV
jgi:hypothetical protein